MANNQSVRRRTVLLQGLGTAAATTLPLAGPAVAQPAVSGANRYALLVGNRAYPDGQDLPSMHTNVRRLQAALEKHGFQCITHFDASRAAAIQAVADFSRDLKSKPPGVVSLFYFCGHGMQMDAENFLMPAGILPKITPLPEARKVNVELGRDVRDEVPQVQTGIRIAVIDACRTSIRNVTTEDGLNQVRAKQGELVVFSTGGGKFALAPIDENRLTFFTDALVKRLDALAAKPEELTFPEMFRLVGADTERTMKAHPVPDIRLLAQTPFIADNSELPVRVSLRPPERKVEPSPKSAEEEASALEALRALVWPRDIQRAATDFLQKFADSPFASAVEVAQVGSAAGARVLSNPDITLQRRDFQPRPDIDGRYNEDLRRASRGDKDAAVRVAERLRPNSYTGPAATIFEGWMQFASELGNGIAAYELARYYSAANRPAVAGRWEARAKQLGYTIPPSLRISR